MLKLEVGKTYETSPIEFINKTKKLTVVSKVGSDKFNCLCIFKKSDSKDSYGCVWYSEAGECSDCPPWNLVKEYKEPVTHRRDIVWHVSTKHNDIMGSGKIDVTITRVGEPAFHNPRFWIEAHRQTVEYIEKT